MAYAYPAPAAKELSDLTLGSRSERMAPVRAGPIWEKCCNRFTEFQAKVSALVGYRLVGTVSLTDHAAWHQPLDCTELARPVGFRGHYADGLR